LMFITSFGEQNITYKCCSNFLIHLYRTFGIIAKYESDIPSKYWMDIPKNEQLNYMKMMREARIQLTKAGIYDPKMMNFLKKVRCKENPSNFECALNDE
ncbi:putative solute-binding protein, partial [Acinetobacter baumannii]